jgi:sterol 3beta-glucosyltransferase
MHYGIIAIGSRGDVQPFVALALGLIDRGHCVTLMAHENFKEFVEGYGIDFHPLPGSVEEMLYSPKGRKVLRSGNMLVFMHFVNKEVSKNQARVNEALFSGAQKAEVFVTSVLGMIWIDAIAGSSDKRYATVQLSFPTTPTSEFPCVLLDFLDFPLYNRFTYRIFDFLYTKDNKKKLNIFRQSLGLPKAKGLLLQNTGAAKSPHIYAVSPSFLPRPADWPERAQLTGFIHLPPKRREQNPLDGGIPAALIHWLEAGEKPIYVGFGSIPVPDPARFIRVLHELLTETAYRFIFCQGWSKIEGLAEHPRLFVLATANHDWLFPRCRAVITHGGIGTVAAALRAKAPLIVASIFADQPWWGKRVERSGLGIHLPFQRWSKEKVVTAIRKTETVEIQHRVTEIGERMSREDGLQQTIAALENYFSNASGPERSTASGPERATAGAQPRAAESGQQL